VISLNLVLAGLRLGLKNRQVGAQFNVGHTVIGRLWTLNNRLIVYNGDRKVADLKVRQAHQDRLEDGNYGGVQLMEVVQQVF
jgi:hypothetical protein